MSVGRRFTLEHRAPPSFYLFARSPLGTLATGLVLGTGFLALMALIELLSGRPQALLRGIPPVEVGCEFLPGDYRIAVVGIILLAFALTARFKLSQWTHDALAVLGRPEVTEAESLASSRAWGFLPGLLGIVICLLVAVDIAERDVEWTRDYWILPHIHNWGWCLPFGWVGGRLIYSLFANAIIVSGVAKGLKIESLENKEPVEAAVRHGLRSALISLMFLGIVSVHFIDPGLDLPAIVFLVVLSLVGVGISALPAFGVVRSFEHKRDKELELIRDEMRTEEAQLLAKDPDYEPGRIGDLVAMEQRLVNWQVKLFRFSTLMRLMIYVVIGFLSWLGAAAVSVFVEGFFE